MLSSSIYWCSAEKGNASVALVTVSVSSDYRRKVFLSIPNNGVRLGFAVEDSCGFKDYLNIGYLFMQL